MNEQRLLDESENGQLILFEVEPVEFESIPDKQLRINAERVYNARLKAKFEAMDQRFERGERLQAWELRIVRNRMENGREIKGAA